MLVSLFSPGLCFHIFFFRAVIQDFSLCESVCVFSWLIFSEYYIRRYLGILIPIDTVAAFWGSHFLHRTPSWNQFHSMYIAIIYSFSNRRRWSNRVGVPTYLCINIWVSHNVAEERHWQDLRVIMLVKCTTTYCASRRICENSILRELDKKFRR